MPELYEGEECVCASEKVDDVPTLDSDGPRPTGVEAVRRVLAGLGVPDSVTPFTVTPEVPESGVFVMAAVVMKSVGAVESDLAVAVVCYLRDGQETASDMYIQILAGEDPLVVSFPRVWSETLDSAGVSALEAASVVLDIKTLFPGCEGDSSGLTVPVEGEGSFILAVRGGPEAGRADVIFRHGWEHAETIVDALGRDRVLSVIPRGDWWAEVLCTRVLTVGDFKAPVFVKEVE